MNVKIKKNLSFLIKKSLFIPLRNNWTIIILLILLALPTVANIWPASLYKKTFLLKVFVISISIFIIINFKVSWKVNFISNQIKNEIKKEVNLLKLGLFQEIFLIFFVIFFNIFSLILSKPSWSIFYSWSVFLKNSFFCVVETYFIISALLILLFLIKSDVKIILFKKIFLILVTALALSTYFINGKLENKNKEKHENLITGYNLKTQETSTFSSKKKKVSEIYIPDLFSMSFWWSEELGFKKPVLEYDEDWRLDPNNASNNMYFYPEDIKPTLSYSFQQAKEQIELLKKEFTNTAKHSKLMSEMENTSLWNNMTTDSVDSLKKIIYLNKNLIYLIRDRELIVKKFPKLFSKKTTDEEKFVNLIFESYKTENFFNNNINSKTTKNKFIYRNIWRSDKNISKFDYYFIKNDLIRFKSKTSILFLNKFGIYQLADIKTWYQFYPNISNFNDWEKYIDQISNKGEETNNMLNIIKQIMPEVQSYQLANNWTILPFEIWKINIKNKKFSYEKKYILIILIISSWIIISRQQFLR